LDVVTESELFKYITIKNAAFRFSNVLFFNLPNPKNQNM
jgi:hypothetical protein